MGILNLRKLIIYYLAILIFIFYEYNSNSKDKLTDFSLNYDQAEWLVDDYKRNPNLEEFD
jgi:hypothetical protein